MIPFTKPLLTVVLIFSVTIPCSFASETVVTASSPEGVELFGSAKIDVVKGKPDEVEASGMAGESLVMLGKWSKPNPDEVKVIFRPDVPKDGFYDVYVRWFTGAFAAGATDSLPITVISEKSPMTLRFTQQLGNVWTFLGTFPFKAGRSGAVVADATGTFGLSNINGVKLVAAKAPPKVQKARNVDPGKTPPDEFDKLRLRVVESLTPPLNADLENPIVAEKIAQSDAMTYLMWKTMRKGEGNTELWTDMPVGRDISKNEGGGWPLALQYRRLVEMAAAYASSSWPLGFGGKMQGDPELLADVLYGLEFFYKYRFNEETKNKLGADWIANEMNQPQAILEIILLLYPHVKPEFVEKQIATMARMNSDPRKMYGGGGTSTGFNRLGFVYMHVLRGIVQRNQGHIEMALEAIWDQLDNNDRNNPLLSTKGTPMADGFYEDGSFIQHEDIPYMPIYGANVLNIFASLNWLLQGSKWELKNTKADLLNDWVFKGIEPLIYNGDLFYRTTGRSVGQSWIQNNGAAYRMIDSVARMVPSASPENRKAFEGMIKTWMQDDYFKNAYRWNNYKLTMPVVLEVERILNDLSIVARPRPLGPRVFYNTDYVVYHRPGYAASLSMSSTRIATHEMMQGVNNLGWYQGEGTLFVHTPDPTRFNEDFWPTINPYRLPGITVDTQERKRGDTGAGNQGKRSTSPWAGGVQLGDYAIASMGLAAQESTLTAQRSWFFVGDQIVCLGSAIHSTDNRPIETIVENAKLNTAGDNAFVVDGRAEPDSLGWSAELKGVKWAHLRGSFAGADIGWIFPEGSDLRALRETRTGKWQDLFVRDKERGERSNHFLTLWYDHGSSPSAASYAYIILPGKDLEATKTYAAKPSVQILANSSDVQAVSVPSLGVKGITFWNAGTAGGVSSSGKASVLIQDGNGTLEIAISDPTQLEKSVEITIDSPLKTQVFADERIKVLSFSPLRLAVNLDRSAGAPIAVSFRK